MLSILIPTYNERENMPPLLQSLARCLPPEHEIIVIDDNSPDGTAAEVSRMMAADGRIRLLKRAGKLGLTSAIVSGLAESKGDVIVVMDADLSHPPEMAPVLAEKVRLCDLAVGSRLIPGGKVERWPLHRKLISKAADSLARLVLGVRISDPLSGFFAIRRPVMAGTRFRTKGYKLLLNILADNPGINVCEVPYVFRDRNAGKTKLGGWEVARFVSDLFRIRFGARR